MMQLKVSLIVLLLVLSNSLFAQCLTKNEKMKIQLSINEIDEYYKDVPNYIKCKYKNSNLEKFVCASSDYMLMFSYLSKANVYAYENAVKNEVNHQDFNKKNMNHWKETYNAMDINNKHLCFDIKQNTMDLMGGESPYQFIKLNDKSYSFQKNSNGSVLTSRDGLKIYLGRNCDVLDSKKQSGRWYKQSGNFFIEIGDIKYKIPMMEPIKLKINSCKK